MNDAGFDLSGCVALVTGASTGIGAAIATKLALAGAHVALIARRAELLEETSASIPGAVAIPADLADEAQLETVVQRTVDELGRLDILVNNAARAD